MVFWYDGFEQKKGGVFVYGAILGDIAGSRYEFSRPSHFRPWQVDLFGGTCRYTDDTVMSVAVKYALLTGTPYAKAFHLFGNRYPKAGYGVMFKQWLETGSMRGYNSLGNGGAMRVSFIGHWALSLEEAEAQAALSADCTHNHSQGIAAAKCTAGAVYLALHGAKKSDIMHYASRYGYSVHRPLALYRPFGKFDVTAAGTMPLALRCFYESQDWESCIRNAFSVKCDTDTVSCIAGGIADAFYGGTGMDEERLLYKYLVQPDRFGRFDRFLYEWAIQKWERREPV